MTSGLLTSSFWICCRFSERTGKHWQSRVPPERLLSADNLFKVSRLLIYFFVNQEVDVEEDSVVVEIKPYSVPGFLQLYRWQIVADFGI